METFFCIKRIILLCKNFSFGSKSCYNDAFLHIGFNVIKILSLTLVHHLNKLERLSQESFFRGSLFFANKAGADAVPKNIGRLVGPMH